MMKYNVVQRGFYNNSRELYRCVQVAVVLTEMNLQFDDVYSYTPESLLLYLRRLAI